MDVCGGGIPAPGHGLTAAEVKQLLRLQPWRVAVDAVATWATLLGGLALAIFVPHPAVYAVVFVVVGARQLALSHLVHEASHYNISRNKALNDWISDLFFAGPVLISTASYRAQHEPHHAFLGDADRDTDVRAWYTLRGWSFLQRTVFSLFGGEALKTIGNYSGGKRDLRRTARQGAVAAFGNSLLLGACWLLDAPGVYFGLWLLPLFTVTIYLLVLRVIAEHQRLDYAPLGRDDLRRSIDAPLTRTITAGPVERFILGSMNFCYHNEHHLFPRVPYGRLPELHRLLRERGYYAGREEAIAESYVSVLRALVFAREPGEGGLER